MRHQIDEVDRDIGVSEVIGFIVILGLMVTGIALITLYGYPILLQEQANANIKNMEKNLIVLQTDVNSLSFRSVPYKEAMLQIGGGALSVNSVPDSSNIDILVEGTSVFSNPIFDGQPFKPGKLIYSSSDNQADVVLENGAVSVRYWSDPHNSVMLSEPRWYYDAESKTLVIPLIKITSENDLSRTSMSTVKMQLAKDPIIPNPKVPPPYEDIDVGELKIKYDWSISEPSANYQKSWERYFETLGLQKDGGYYTNTNPNQIIENLVIKEYTVEIVDL